MPRGTGRDRDAAGRPRNARRRDALGRPLPRDPSETASDATVAGEAEDPPALPPGEALAAATQLIGSGRAFAAHEVLEAVWKAAPAAERELWRGLAQVAVGVTHAQRGNPTGAARLFERAAGSLAPYDVTAPHGVDVSRLRTWLSQAAAGSVDPLTPPPLASQRAG